MFYLSKKKPLPPRVILVQGLLRKQGHDVPITGKWDEKTDKAIAKYRTELKMDPQGPVNKDVFFQIIQDTKLKVIDSVDKSSGDAAKVTRERMAAVGVKPLLNPRVVGAGVKNAIDLIIERAKDHKIALLRFFAHGNRGVWIAVALGDPVHALKDGKYKEYEEMKKDFYSYIDYSHFERHRQVLSKLTPLFAPFGSVELNTCKIGNQDDLLVKLANTWEVPVTGGYDNQCVGDRYKNEFGETVFYENEFGERVDSTFEMEGKVFTAYPNSHNLESWAAKVEKAVPSLPRMVNQVQNYVTNAVKGR